MLAPAPLVTVALVLAAMPSSAKPVMVPALKTEELPWMARIPYEPPAMLAPALLVTVVLVSASMPAPMVP